MKVPEAEDVNGTIVSKGTLGACATVRSDPWLNARESDQSLRTGLTGTNDEVSLPALRMRRLGGLTDEQLMMACQRGRQEALEELYRRHHRAVFGFVLRLVQDCQLAEDLVQETFLRVYGNRERWQPRSKFTSWLYRIARNLCIDEKRRYWNRLVHCDADMRVGESGDSQSVIDLREDNNFNARQKCAQAVHAEMIKRAVNSLSHDQREVIILNKYQGLSYIEIADILGVTAESIKQRAYRAHLKLREILRPIMEEYE